MEVIRLPDIVEEAKFTGPKMKFDYIFGVGYSHILDTFLYLAISSAEKMLQRKFFEVC